MTHKIQDLLPIGSRVQYVGSTIMSDKLFGTVKSHSMQSSYFYNRVVWDYDLIPVGERMMDGGYDTEQLRLIDSY